MPFELTWKQELGIESVASPISLSDFIKEQLEDRIMIYDGRLPAPSMTFYEAAMHPAFMVCRICNAILGTVFDDYAQIWNHKLYASQPNFFEKLKEEIIAHMCR